MDNAEKRAMEYTGWCRNQSYKDFLNGYKRAERDLKLTYKDIVLLRTIFDATDAQAALCALKFSPMTREYYEFILEQFNKYEKP